MGVVRQGCPVITMLTVQELGHLNRIENPANELQPVNWCALGPGHDGPWHYAEVQGGGVAGDQEWWLRWNDRSREVLVLPGCEAKGTITDDDEDPQVCLLFADHPGDHGFDRTPIESAVDWHPQLTVGQLRAVLAKLPDHTPIRLAATEAGLLDGTGEAVVVDTLVGMTEVRGGVEQGRRPHFADALVLIADHAGTLRQETA